jgi:hypothetical protein
MKNPIVKTLVIALCFVFYGISIAETIQEDYEALRTEYFSNAKGKAQHFITQCIR